MAHFEKIYEVKAENEPNDWNLCFQWGTYTYDDGASERGYRFIYLRPDNTYQPARGQARIPSLAAILDLLQKAAEAGWLGRCEQEGPGTVQ